MKRLSPLRDEYRRSIVRARESMGEQGLDALPLFAGPHLVYFIGSAISGVRSRVGRGIRLVVTELPSLKEEGSTVLASDMIVTIQPGVAWELFAAPG